MRRRSRRGSFPGTVVQDAVIDNRQVMIGGTTGILGEWGPERVDNKYEGAISARDGAGEIQERRDGAARHDDRGSTACIALAKKAGIESPLRPFPATFLGSSEVTLMEMTLANTIFPNGGMRPERSRSSSTGSRTRTGKVVYKAKTGREARDQADDRFEVHTCLAEVLERGTADRTFTDSG